jgi:hypothetical protein
MEEKKISFVKMVEFPGKLDAEFSLDPIDFSPKWWKNLIREERRRRRSSEEISVGEISLGGRKRRRKSEEIFSLFSVFLFWNR